MKRCRKCQQAKPLDEFYPHPETADKREGSCKACRRKDVVQKRLRAEKRIQGLESEVKRLRGIINEMQMPDVRCRF